MKSVLISIQPKWCELIASGKKKVEVRKTKPKLDVPFKCYIYCTTNKQGVKDLLEIHGTDGKIRKANGKVIGEFVCNNIDNHTLSNLIVKEDAEHTLNGTCLTKEDVLNYLGYQKGTSIFACKNYGFYGWHISDFVIYDKPKELSEFFIYCGDNPKCEGCEAHYYSNTESGLEDYCCSNIDGCRPLKRPPQSWCYIDHPTEKGGVE